MTLEKKHDGMPFLASGYSCPVPAAVEQAALQPGQLAEHHSRFDTN